MTMLPYNLDEVLSILREEHRQIKPPSCLEAKLLETIPSPPPAIRARRWFWSFTLAPVLVVLIVWLSIRLSNSNHEVLREPPAQTRAVEIAQPIPMSGFIVLPSAETLPRPREVRIWRVRIAKCELAQYGFEVPPTTAADLIYADFAVGEDGLPREIRLVR
jgi:hypothetical protein